MKRSTALKDRWPTYAATCALAVVPYLIVTWAVAEFLKEKFWVVLGWLLAARLFFATVEFAGSVLSWRLVGKREVTALLLSQLTENRMPPRYYSHDTFLSYLARVQDDESASPEVKAAALGLERMAEIWDSRGPVFSFRFFAAAEAALEEHSPIANARESEDS